MILFNECTIFLFCINNLYFFIWTYIFIIKCQIYTLTFKSRTSLSFVIQRLRVRVCTKPPTAPRAPLHKWRPTALVCVHGVCVHLGWFQMQSTNSEYGSLYLVVYHVTHNFFLLIKESWRKQKAKQLFSTLIIIIKFAHQVSSAFWKTIYFTILLNSFII